MPIASPDSCPASQPRRRARRPGWLTALLVVLVLVAPTGLSGCAWLAPSAESAHSVPGDVRAGVDRVLARRGAAVRRLQRTRFVRTTEPGRFRSAQRVWFDNLAQLPLAVFDQRLDGPLRETGSGWSGVVRTRTQLRGFDRVPVVTWTAMTFVASGRGWLVTGSRAVDSTVGVANPWDHGAVQVTRQGPVLVVSDPASSALAASVARETAAAMDQVRHRLPWHWPERVLVQLSADTRALRAAGPVPGGDPERVEAVTHRVRGAGQRLAASRVVLSPRLLTAGATTRARVLRHELTHVALGQRNDRIPLWLSEGVAEYLATATLAPADRVIDAAVVDRLASGAPPMTLPSDRALRQRATTVQYGLSWFACVVLAQRFGEARLWQLVEQTAEGGRASLGEVLTRLTGWDEQQVARSAAQEILSVYR